MYFEIAFNLSLHRVGEFEACQTQLIFPIRFLSLSWHHGSKKINVLQAAQNRKTRNINSKNLNQNVFLTNTFAMNSSIAFLKTNYQFYSLERLRFYHFSLKPWFLVSCRRFCSFSLTEVLTGLPQTLSSDWLMWRCLFWNVYPIFLIPTILLALEFRS